MNSIEVKNVTKCFKGNAALNNVSLDFKEDKIYGLLGRNGAGKSTLLNIITSRIFADSGSVYVDGMPSETDISQGKIYLMNESNLYPEKMSIKDIFKWTNEFYPNFDNEYAGQLAEAFKLNIKKNTRSLSTGYNSIFKIIIAMSVNVPYVFFDEPVLGLDANHREMFYKMLIEKYSKKPFAAIISTHLIEEVSNVIEDVIIIKDGNIIRSESRDDILKQGYTVSGSAAAIDNYSAGKNVIGTDSIGGLKTAYILGNPDKENLPAGLEISGMDLQKLFVQLTNS